MAKKRLPPIHTEIVDDFKRKVHLAYPGETGAYWRETETAIKKHAKALDRRIARIQKSNLKSGA